MTQTVGRRAGSACFQFQKCKAAFASRPLSRKLKLQDDEVVPVSRNVLRAFELVPHKDAEMQHWDDLRYLLALEENGNLIKAAKQLRTNPTTVSRHIKRLSETYKRTLVTRQPNGEWILTKDGMLFATAAKRCDVEIGMLNGCAETHQQRLQ